MIQDWDRWIAASVESHFREKLDGHKVYIEGRVRETVEADLFEIRLSGPFRETRAGGNHLLTVMINVLVKTLEDSHDAFKHHRRVGLAGAAFTNCISVKRYGDDVTHFGELQLFTDVVTVSYGLSEKIVGLQHSTVEGHYRMLVEE